MRYIKPRRNRFRSNNKGFGRNGSHDLRSNSINSGSKNFQRPFGRNGLKAESLLEKYNDLAKEALSNGDKILSESYSQHADHFLRVIENRNSIHGNTKPNLEKSPIEKNSNDKVILEEKNNTTAQSSHNSEEV